MSSREILEGTKPHIQVVQNAVRTYSKWMQMTTRFAHFGNSEGQSGKQVPKFRVDSQSDHRHKYNKSRKGHAVISLWGGEPLRELRDNKTGF